MEKDISFFTETGSLCSLEHLQFVQSLHGIDVATFFGFHESNLTKGSSSNDLELFKVCHFEMEIEDSIQERFDELTESLLLFVSRRCNHSLAFVVHGNQDVKQNFRVD